jgi:integrase
MVAAKTTRFYALYLVLATGGLRPSEAFALLWADIDFAASGVWVRRSLSRKKSGGWTLAEPKTDSSVRFVSLEAGAMGELTRHRERQEAEYATPGYQHHGFVFALGNGSPLDAKNLGVRYFKPLLKAAGLPSIPLYGLRHTSVSVDGEMGGSLTEAAAKHGHASTRMTGDVYSWVFEKQHRDAADRMDALLFS